MEELYALPHFWILGEDGRTPVPAPDLTTWGEFMEDWQKRQVAYDVNPHTGVGASTIFYGMKRFGPNVDKVMFFETMVFTGDSPTFIRLSATWEFAEELHMALCAVYGIPTGVTPIPDGGVPNA